MPREHESQTAIALVDPLVGTIFDKRFHVDERIAAGGFGAIYRATHVKSGHPIALKVLLPALAQDLGVVARFRREGATMTTLRSPHTITAYELGQAADRTLFIVMELLHGESLFERYQSNGPLEWKRVVKIAIAVCESLAEAHALGIVHRDLKPTNIHLEQQGDDPDYVKVLDFGIAKILRGSDFEAGDITNAGQMIGTLDYMSPEQMVGGQVTGQTDIYTLGIVMYEVIAGCRPFPEAVSAAAALAAMLKTTPQSLYLRAPVPKELDHIVMRCLERETHKRYKTVGELRTELQRLLGEVKADTATVAMGLDDDDSTKVTPPPEKILQSLARASQQGARRKVTPVAVAEWVDEDESAQTRTPAWNERFDHGGIQEWDDEDEHMETLKKPVLPNPREPKPSDSDVKTPPLGVNPARGSARHEQPSESDVRPPPGDRRTPARASTISRPPPAPPVSVPRPLEARHRETPVPQVVVAPFSTTPRPSRPSSQHGPPTPPSSQHGALPPGQLPSSQHGALLPGQLPSSQHGALPRVDPHAPTEQHGAVRPDTISSPHHTTLPGSNPFGRTLTPPQPSTTPSPPFGSSTTPAPQPPFGASLTPAPQPPFGTSPTPAPQPPFGASPTPQTPFGASPTPQTPFGASPTPQTPFGASPTPQTPFGATPAPRAPFPATPIPHVIPPTPMPFPPSPSSMFPATPPPPSASPYPSTVPGRGNFELSRLEARETTIRRVAWTLALVLAAIAGFFLATYL